MSMAHTQMLRQASGHHSNACMCIIQATDWVCTIYLIVCWHHLCDHLILLTTRLQLPKCKRNFTDVGNTEAASTVATYRLQDVHMKWTLASQACTKKGNEALDMRSWNLKGIEQPARCACYFFRAGLFRQGACVGVLPSVHCEPWGAVHGQNFGLVLAHVACVGTPWGIPNAACIRLSLLCRACRRARPSAGYWHGPLQHSTPGRHS